MNKYFKLNIVVFFICFIASCANDTSTNTTGTDSGTATSTSTNATDAVAKSEPHPLSGTLDILIAPRKAFTDLGMSTKLVYSHNFGTDGKVHLKGWVLVGNNFPGPTMPLQNGGASNETFDQDTYFSNVVLSPADFNKIRNSLLGDTNLQFVLFLPYKVDTYFVGYHIYTSITSAFSTPGLAATAEANPSPPRTN
jgi:hypothetical protein